MIISCCTGNSILTEEGRGADGWSSVLLVDVPVTGSGARAVWGGGGVRCEGVEGVYTYWWSWWVMGGRQSQTVTGLHRDEVSYPQAAQLVVVQRVMVPSQDAHMFQCLEQQCHSPPQGQSAVCTQWQSCLPPPASWLLSCVAAHLLNVTTITAATPPPLSGYVPDSLEKSLCRASLEALGVRILSIHCKGSVYETICWVSMLCFTWYSGSSLTTSSSTKPWILATL